MVTEVQFAAGYIAYVSWLQLLCPVKDTADVLLISPEGTYILLKLRMYWLLLEAILMSHLLEVKMSSQTL